MRVALTDRFVAGAKCPDGKTDEDFFDEKTAGLSLRVFESGKRSWNYNYTNPSRKRVRIVLGTYPTLSLASARTRALEARGHLEADPPRDPRLLMGGDQQAMCVRDLVSLYLTKYVAKRGKDGKPLKSGKQIERRLNKNVVPLIGNVALKDLHRRDLARVIDPIVERGAGVEANRTLSNLCHLLKWGADRGDLDAAFSIPKPTQELSRERTLDDDEVCRFWNGMEEAIPSVRIRRILKVCLILGTRSGEASGLKKSEVDLKTATWTLPPERTKNGKENKLPLPGMAVQIIEDAIADAPHGDAVFSGVDSIDVAQFVKRAQKHYGLATAFTCHDLRRTASTNWEKLRIPLEVAEALLGHAGESKSGIRKVYRRYDYAKEKREALELWESRLLAIVGSGAVAEIIPLAARGS